MDALWDLWYQLCGGAPIASCAARLEPSQDVAVELFRERNAMILGMNPSELRKQRHWCALLWRMKRHWALVLQPAGDAFEARVVDDFVRGAQSCFRAEVPSAKLFLVYELLVEQGEPFLSLSVKPDFDSEHSFVKPLGPIGPVSFSDIERCALNVAQQYRGYSLVGCNCQHFVKDLAQRIGLPQIDLPDDQLTADAAWDGAAAVGAVGGTTLTAAVGVSLLTASSAPFYIATASAATGAIGMLSAMALVIYACSYRHLYDSFRKGSIDDGAQAEVVAARPGASWSEAEGGGAHVQYDCTEIQAST